MESIKRYAVRLKKKILIHYQFYMKKPENPFHHIKLSPSKIVKDLILYSLLS